MAASYPTSAKSFTAINDGDVVSDEMFEEAYDEITAIEQALVSTGLAHDLFPDATTRTLGTAAKPWGDTYLAAAKKLYLDGGGDTYLHEETANHVRLFVGGVPAFEAGTGSRLGIGGTFDFAVSATKRLYLDGGGDTYFVEEAANQVRLKLAGADHWVATATHFILPVGMTLQFGAHSALGAETVSGYITVTDAGGVSRKLAVVS